MNRLLLCSTVLALATSAALAAAGPRRSTRREFYSELRAAPSVTAIPASNRSSHDVGRCMGTGCRGGHLPVGK